MTIEEVARTAHEANKVICEAQEDFTQAHWEQAEPWQRESAIEGVRWRLANPNAPASSQHEAWCADKRQAGWVYGEVKDAEKRTHPCLVSFDELPPMQQAKDAVFTAIVQACTPYIEQSVSA